MNITDGFYKAAYQQGAPASEVDTTESRPVKKPTRVNDISAKDDKNRMNAELDLSASEQKYLEELRKRDQEVRDHEMAHKRVAGKYAGTVTYTYQTGPDNKQYAIGGKTQLDTAKEPEPQENIKKQDIIYKAALAPKEPSRKDKEVAAEAEKSKQESQIELSREEADAEKAKMTEQASANETSAATQDYQQSEKALQQVMDQVTGDTSQHLNIFA